MCKKNTRRYRDEFKRMNVKWWLCCTLLFWTVGASYSIFNWSLNTTKKNTVLWLWKSSHNILYCSCVHCLLFLNLLRMNRKWMDEEEQSGDKFDVNKNLVVKRSNKISAFSFYPKVIDRGSAAGDLVTYRLSSMINVSNLIDIYNLWGAM